jgi:hypothetical protein
MPLFDPSNLPYWILLGMGIGLFLFIILSGGGDGDSDADFDADTDVDAEVGSGHSLHVDTDADADELSAGQILGWLGIGKAPLMLLLATDISLWGLVGWAINVFVGGALGELLGGTVGGAVLLGSLMISLFMGGQIAKPVGKIFASFGEDASSDRLVGCMGKVSTGTIPVAGHGRIGQVDVLDSARNLVTVNAVLPEWATTIPQRGSKVLVIERSGTYYVVIAKDSPDYDHWYAGSSISKDSR